MSMLSLACVSRVRIKCLVRNGNMNRLKNFRLTSNRCIELSKMEQAIMEDIEDHWIRPPLPYPIWSYDRNAQSICIYDMDRFKKVFTKYFNSVNYLCLALEIPKDV